MLILAASAGTMTNATMADTFGTGANEFTIDFVTIGNPGNPPPPSSNWGPYGPVAYTYQMGTYEVSRDMFTKANNVGNLGITMPNWGDSLPKIPAMGVSWFDAAKFVNWLNTSKGHAPAYNFDAIGNLNLWSVEQAWKQGGENLYRNKDSYYFLPNENEWVKSAYYVSGAQYNYYPTPEYPTAVFGGTEPNTAVYYNYHGQPPDYETAPPEPANVDNAGGLSPYGTMGQAGNAWERLEPAYSGANTDWVMRGGSFADNSFYFELPTREGVDPSYRGYYIGFRVAAVSENAGLFTYEVIDGSTVTITGYPKNATGPVEIPAEIEGKPVTSIGNYAFEGCSGLTSVTIPNSVTSIGDSPFFGCTGLTSVTIPKSVTNSGWFAFRGCSGLTSITLEQGLTDIGYGMFNSCTGLTNVTIPSSVTTIRDWAFRDCSGLTGITLEQGLTGIGYGMFYGCSGLISVTIPSSITSIGGLAFVGCRGLTSVTIPSNVTSIGSFWRTPDGESIYHFPAFSSCTRLTRAVFLGNAPKIEPGEFSGTAPGFTVYYLCGRTGFNSWPDSYGIPTTMINGTGAKLEPVISRKTGAQSARRWTVTLNNKSSCPAAQAKIDSITLVQTFGPPCKPVITSPKSFPLNVGDISGNGSASADVVLNFTGCANTARFTVKIAYSFDNGAVKKVMTLNNQFR